MTTPRPEPPKPGHIILPPARPPTPSQEIHKWDGDGLMAAMFVVGVIGIGIMLALGRG